MNSFQRGRATGMPGTETSVTLYPQRLGARLRNSIIRMLERGVISGGGSSESRRIAEALVEQYGLHVSAVAHHLRVTVRGLTEAAAPIIRSLVVADYAAMVLENPGYNGGYFKSCSVQALASIDNRAQAFFMVLHDKESVCKVTETLAEHTSQEHKDKSKHVVSMLKGTEPIHLITF